MTAEIGVINQRGVAIAADSAMTMSDGTVLNNATKIFNLGENHYVGMMIYGNAEFMQTPWEVIIKTFKEKMNNTSEPDLKRYVKAFLKYISDLNIYTPNAKLNYIASYCDQFCRNELQNNNIQTEGDIEKILWRDQKALQKRKQLLDIDEEQFIKDYGNNILNIFQQYYNVSENTASLFLKVFYNYVSSDMFSPNYTGIVFAGYGKDESFPSIINLEVDGLIYGQLKYITKKIDDLNPMLEDSINAAIVPFAQQDMPLTILNGIDPDLDDLRYKQLVDLKDELLEQFGIENKEYLDSTFARVEKEFEREITLKYRQPIVSMIKNLSLGELGNMAETMVSLTSFKRKYSGSVRTVGGPVDVMVISRDEGAIWLKHKDYSDFD